MDKGSNAATASKMDANANITNKNISTLAGEIYKDFNIQINRSMIKDILEEKYGKDEANGYEKGLKEHLYYINDESNLLYPYCVSVSLYPFLLSGTKSLGGVSEAPKNLQAFCGSYINLVFQIASQYAGAVATPEVLMMFDYFARKQYGYNYLVDHKEVVHQCFQQIVYSLNQPAASRTYQCPFTNFAIFDEGFFEGIFGNFYFTDGEKANWRYVDLIQREFLTWFNKERTKELLTFPVISASLLTNGTQPIDGVTAKFLCEELSEGNSFFIYTSDSPDSLSSCCRLKNEISNNEFSYTLGSGGVKTGSKKVITINLNRVIQTNKNWKLGLKKVVQRVHKYLLAHEDIFQQLFDAGMLPVYSANFISLKDQFLTVGINGMVEAAEYLGFKPGNNKEYKDFLQELFGTISKENKQLAKDTGLKINCEAVPAENLGVKAANWDREDGLEVPRDCYNSYFYPVEDESINLIDKFELHGGDILQYLDGGSALHLNLESYPTWEGYYKLIELAIKTGCSYFTTNVLVTLCKDCGYINKNTKDICSKCNSNNISHATRIIGYLREIDNFSSDRQIEAHQRYYHK